MQKNNIEYPSPKYFLSLARLHQWEWLRENLGFESTDEKRVLLPADKAYGGYNFFNKQACTSVNNRFPKSFFPSRNSNPKPLICDALRSEHIPFNLFSPLTSQIQHKSTLSFFSNLIDTKIISINEIKIEYADPIAQLELQDKTKFDAYVIARNQNRSIVLCIEVKYTEGPYNWGNTEKKRMFDKSDSYVKITNNSPEFKPQAYKNFRNIHLKQIWRNYLLGIITSKTLDCDYIYLHLFPEGNEYQSTACFNFEQNLTRAGKSTFKPITYEKFIDCAENSLSIDSSSWITYIENRYIVPAI